MTARIEIILGVLLMVSLKLVNLNGAIHLNVHIWLGAVLIARGNLSTSHGARWYLELR